ncbi:MAG TPA: ABC transporter substrate-binding protein [Pyrinomonadaceae bacterium]|jgi:ABC-type branched-subunit amino acid transport system substrate-binding protein
MMTGKLSAAVLVVAAGLSILPLSRAQSVSETPNRLTASERRGKEIYLRGTSSSGREIAALLGEIEVPASTVPCAGCHGLRGEGKSEGGVTAGNLTWTNLVKPYGHTHPSGRKHGPFTESSFIRAVVNGVDPAGTNLLVAMPRYKLTAEDMSDLIAYVKRLDTDLDPGLTDNSVTIGVLLPSAGALADTSVAMKDVFNAYFDDVNSRGGIFSRKIQVRFADAGAGGAATASVAQSFAQKEQVFAFVGGLSAGADEQLAAVARNDEIPFIGPSTLLPQIENPVNRYLFYLLPGVAEQGAALVNFAATQSDLQQASLAIVYSDNPLSAAAAAAAEDRAKKLGRVVKLKQSFASNGFDAKAVVQDLKSKNVAAVFLFGTGKEPADFLREAAATGWAPHLFVLGIMAGKDLPTVGPEFKDKVYLAFPTVPSDISKDGMDEFRALHEKYKFAARHTASQLSAFAAAKVFVEALTRAGKDLSRDKLVTTLEGFYEFETGVTPQITFGPNRRVGAAGAYVISLEDAQRGVADASRWIKASP